MADLKELFAFAVNHPTRGPGICMFRETGGKTVAMLDFDEAGARRMAQMMVEQGNLPAGAKLYRYVLADEIEVKRFISNA